MKYPLFVDSVVILVTIAVISFHAYIHFCFQILIRSLLHLRLLDLTQRSSLHENLLCVAPELGSRNTVHRETVQMPCQAVGISREIETSRRCRKFLELQLLLRCKVRINLRLVFTISIQPVSYSPLRFVK